MDSIRQALTRIDDEFNRQYPKYSWAVNNETASLLYGNICVAYWRDTIPPKLWEKINNHRPYFTSNAGVDFYDYLGTYLHGTGHTIDNDIKYLDSTYPRPKADIIKMSLLSLSKDSFASTYPEILNSMKTAWCKSLVAHALKDATTKQKKMDSLLASDRNGHDTAKFIGTFLG